MSKLLTVVIAAYNKEDLLPRCLDSLIVPSIMEDVEILIVNDGSKDNTLFVAQQYAARYPDYFIAIDKPNGNYGSVMNKGLSMANGKYFRTLDADDWYNTSIFEEYIEQLRQTDADLVLSERVDVWTQTNKKQHFSFGEEFPLFEDLQVSDSFWHNANILTLVYVMGMCYKTQLLKDSGLKWTEGICYTDAEYCVWPLPLVQTVRFVPLPLYQYVRDADGQSTEWKIIRKNFNQFVTVSRKVLDYYISHKDCKEVQGLFIKFLATDLLANVYTTLIYDGLKNKQIIDRFEEDVKQCDELYARTGMYNHYRNLKYVDAYRNNRIFYLFIRLDYLLRSNSIFRKIFMKA